MTHIYALNLFIAIVINVDCRATLSTLSRALQEIFSVPETSYCFFSLRDNEETEIQDYSRRIQNVLCQGDNLRVRFCRRLQPYEGRVSVFLLKIDDVTVSSIYALCIKSGNCCIIKPDVN